MMRNRARARGQAPRRYGQQLLSLVIFALAWFPWDADGAGGPSGPSFVPVAANGPVTGFASIGSTLYLLGPFTSIGANTGGGVPVDVVSGRLATSLARVNGAVYACVADGNGGWFLGGDFTAVGGVPRKHVARIAAEGSVTPWMADADGVVRALALDGQTLYMGGDFTQVAGQERDHLAAVSRNFGELTPWNPSVSGIALAFTTVYCILPVRDVVYVGGDFTSVGGANRRCLAALGRSMARILEFDPEPDYAVRALAIRDSSLFLGGAFYGIKGQLYPGLACVSTITGKVRSWGSGVSHPDYGYSDVDAYVAALVVSDSSLYVAGHFTRVGNVVRGGLAAVDLTTGLAQDWNPNPVDETSLRQAPWMYALTVKGELAYVGGHFGVIGSADRWSVAAVSRATGTVTAFDPRADGEVFALGASERSIFIGGAFSSLGELQVRNQLAAIDLETGALKPWNPDPGWGQVMCIAANERAVYVGGRFTTVNGMPRENIVALDPVSGDVTNWNPGAANGFVTAVSCLAVGKEWVYAGGDFSVVGGLPRRSLAAIDTAGRVGPWDPAPNSLVTAICPAESTIYVAGAFRHLGGQLRAGLAEIDTVTGMSTPWNPGTGEDVLALAVGGDDVYVGGQFTEIAGAPRASLGAVDRSTGAATAWNPETGPSPRGSLPIVRGLTIANGVLYVVGDFGQIGGAAHPYAAALDTGSARALDWVPDIAMGPLWSTFAAGRSIYFGGRLTRYGTNPAGGFGMAPAAKTAFVPSDIVSVAPCAPNPAVTSTRVSFNLPALAQVSLTVFDIQGRQVCQPLSPGLRPAGAQSVTVSVDRWLAGCYFCRLQIGNTAFSRKFIVLPK
jgi:hypothetical protein